MKLKGEKLRAKVNIRLWKGRARARRSPKIYLKDFTAAASSSFTSKTV
jgi:hypothetical protein